MPTTAPLRASTSTTTARIARPDAGSALPLLVGWGTSGYVGRSFDVPAVWSHYADDVRPAPIEADHYVAEENPAATLAALAAFWEAT